MQVKEHSLELVLPDRHTRLLDALDAGVGAQLGEGVHPVRLVVTGLVDGTLRCEVGVLSDLPREVAPPPSIFAFRRRLVHDPTHFTAALMIPTGIGAEIGGDAGDGGPATRLLAGVCDTLITHPNAVNGADLNEIPDNCLYVEGSTLTRLLMGPAALQPVLSDRLLLVVDRCEEQAWGSGSPRTCSTPRVPSPASTATPWSVSTTRSRRTWSSATTPTAPPAPCAISGPPCGCLSNTGSVGG
ncbi:DUF3326 domain-containing protein [Streptomyces sp. CA-181903]|uniref:DUF3326 domain-containing protein n=1 Tax=Streptomyces sp. CA-181903 TaxID=3240055 RepID=UPI003D8DFD4B